MNSPLKRQPRIEELDHKDLGNLVPHKWWSLTRFLFAEWGWIRKGKFISRRVTDILKAIWLSFWILVFLTLIFIVFYSMHVYSLSNFREGIQEVFYNTFFPLKEGKESVVPSYMFPFFISPLATYWSLDAVFGRKWSYCAGLFNELVKLRLSFPIPNTKEQLEYFQARFDFLEATLASDLVDLDLYFHKSFSDMTISVLKKALSNKADPHEFLEKLFDSRLPFDEFRDLISEYQLSCKKNLESIYESSISKPITVPESKAAGQEP